MTRLFATLLALIMLATGCDSSETRLEGDWTYQSSGDEKARLDVMEKIFSTTPPSEAELRGMGLSGDDLAAGLETLRLKIQNPEDPGLARVEAEYQAARAAKASMALEVRGDQLILIVGSERHSSQFEIESEDGDKMRLQTTGSDGLTETQTLIWLSETQIRIVDPQGRSMEFVRP